MLDQDPSPGAQEQITAGRENGSTRSQREGNGMRISTGVDQPVVLQLGGGTVVQQVDAGIDLTLNYLSIGRKVQLPSTGMLAP
jgi:hypothetical protein